MKTSLSIFSFLMIGSILVSCTPDESEITEQKVFELPESGIVIENAWARPGRVNGVTAVYLELLNGSTETDTLQQISSPVAGLVELHETFDRGDGMMGMRQVEEPIFPAREAMIMQPGGLHIMLMQLNQPLNEGDEVSVTFNFALAGEITITAPVRSPGQ